MNGHSVHPLRAWRERQKLTLAKLSEQLGEPTIAISTLAYYELGLRIPKRLNMERIRAATGITSDQFYEFRGA